MKKLKWYVGWVKGHPGALSPFQSAKTPTQKDWPNFSRGMGPFKTRRAAIWMATYGFANPHATSIKAVERLAKVFKDRL